MGDGARRILEAAQRLFVEKGYDATSMRDIADDLGTSPGAFYHHFPSKEAVLFSVCSPLVLGFASVADEVSALPAGSPAADVLERVLEMLLQHRSLIHFVANDPGALRHEAIGEPLRSANHRIIDALQRHSGATAIRAGCAIAALHGGMQAITDDDDLEAARAEVVAAALAALG